MAIVSKSTMHHHFLTLLRHTSCTCVLYFYFRTSCTCHASSSSKLCIIGAFTAKRRSLTLTQTRCSSQFRSRPYSFIASFTTSGWTVILSSGSSNTTTICCFILQKTGKNSSYNVGLVARVFLISDLVPSTAQPPCVYCFTEEIGKVKPR